MITWLLWTRNRQEWTIKHQQEFVPGADFYFIDNLRHRDHHDSLLKCQLFELDKYHHHPPEHKNPNYRFNRDDKKYKFLLESTVKVNVVAVAAAVSNTISYQDEIEYCESCSWLSYFAWCILVSVCVHFVIRFIEKRVRKFKWRGSNRFNRVKFEEGKFNLNAVSSIELLRKNKRVKISVNSH